MFDIVDECQHIVETVIVLVGIVIVILERYRYI